MAGFGGLGGLGGLGNARGAVTPLTGDELLQLAQANGGARLEAYNPTIRDLIGNAIYDAAGGLGGLGGTPNTVRENVLGLLDMLPGTGDALAAEEFGGLLGSGDWKDAAIAGGLLALGLIPTGGKIASKGLKKLESRSANIYNPPVKPPRPFEADYPLGAQVDAAGNLVRDIDGRELSARYVVGRRGVPGPDVALPREALDEISKARTGEAIRSVAPGTPDIGQDMGRAVFRSGGSPDYVAVAKSLTEPKRSRVAAHEIGHVIDQTAGEIPAAGLNDELRTVYNDLNNPQSYGKKFGPEQSRYRGGDVQRELIAEALRAYMADPNYLKTVAPKTAARIRQYVNDNPSLKNIIQFNSLAAAGGGLALMNDNPEGY